MRSVGSSSVAWPRHPGAVGQLLTLPEEGLQAQASLTGGLGKMEPVMDSFEERVARWTSRLIIALGLSVVIAIALAIGFSVGGDWL